MDMFREWKRKDSQNRLWSGAHQEEGNEVDLNSLGRKGFEDWWEKRGTSGRRLEWQRRMEKEDTISVQWEQEDVETSYSLINSNNDNNNRTNYARTQSNTAICEVLPYWLLVSTNTAIIRPILYKIFKKIGYIQCVKCWDVWDAIYITI